MKIKKFIAIFLILTSLLVMHLGLADIIESKKVIFLSYLTFAIGMLLVIRILPKKETSR